MVMLGPGCRCWSIGELVDLRQPAATKGALAGNAAVYGVFLDGRVAAGARGHASTSARPTPRPGSLSAVIGLFLVTWAVNVGLVAGYMRWLEGRADRPRARRHVAAAALDAHRSRVRHGGARLPDGDRRRRRLALSGVILIAYSRLQRDLLQAERHAEAARQAATARRGAARRPRADHPRLPRRPRPHDRAPLGRRRPLHAADRRGRRVPGRRAAAWATPPRSTTTSARSCSPTGCSRPASSRTRSGRSSSAIPSAGRSSSAICPTTRTWPRSSSPTTSASTAAAIRAASPATPSRACRA